MTPSSIGRAALILLVFLPLIVLGGYASWPGNNPAEIRDVDMFLASGRNALLGTNPYTLQPRGRGYDVNLNPPVSLLVFAPLARLPRETARTLVYAVSLASYLGAMLAVLRYHRGGSMALRVSAGLALAGLSQTLYQGQVYAVLAALAVTAWLGLQSRRSVVAGVCLGLIVALKPNFLIWPALLLVTGAWVPAAVALATAALLSIAPALAFGPRVHAEWLHGASAIALVNNGLAGAHPITGNLSVVALAVQHGAPWPVAVLIVAATLAAAAAWTWGRRPDAQTASTVAILVSLLTIPSGAAGYTLLALPEIVTARWRWSTRIAILLLVIPAQLVDMVARQGQIIGPVVTDLYVVAVALLLVDAIAPDAPADGAAKPAMG